MTKSPEKEVENTTEVIPELSNALIPMVVKLLGSSRPASVLQLLKQYSEIVVTVVGIKHVDKLVQSRKQLAGRTVRLVLGSTTSVKLVHPEQAELPKVITELGKVSVPETSVLFSNAPDSIATTLYTTVVSEVTVNVLGIVMEEVWVVECMEASVFTPGLKVYIVKSLRA